MQMREIKFRAWLKEAKMMVEVTKIDFANQQLYFAFHSGDIKNTELMQYTGLKDKKGKEIYEGDILRCYASTGELLGGYYDRDGKPLPYTKGIKDGIFKEHRHEINMGVTEGSVTIGSTLFIVSIPDRSEIIGNIYENPELLK